MEASLSNSDLEKLKFPIGKFSSPQTIDRETLISYIDAIRLFPLRLKAEVEKLNETQLDTPYRPEGWTIRQVVHHCADSHMNSLMRFKLALTEDNPTIRPYHEELWAELSDSQSFPIHASLEILGGIHHRWVSLLESLTEEQWRKTFIHPGDKKTVSLRENTGIYAWHCEHHLAHITTLKKTRDW